MAAPGHLEEVLAASRAVPDAAWVRRSRRRLGARRRGLLTALAVLLIAAFGVRVLLGDYTITIADFVRILAGEQIGGATFVLLESKLPRAVLGVLVGAGFGVAGAIFQTTLRNPLASPDIIGISAGASAAAVVAILGLGLSGAPVSAAAVLGALGVATTIRLVAGGIGGYRLVLVGVGMAAVMQSVVQYLFTRADVYDAQVALTWLTGSLNGAAWPTIARLALLVAILLGAIAALSGAMPITELGEEAAVGLGVRPRRTDALLGLAVLLTALCVAAAGPIAFASFLAGPIARSLNRGRSTLAGAGLVGAVIVVLADHAGAYLFGAANLPVGVVTGALGAPFLLWLLATGRRRSAG